MDDDFDDNPYAPPPPDPEDEPVETVYVWSQWKTAQFLLGTFAFFLFVLTLVDVVCLPCYVPGAGFPHVLFRLPPLLTVLLCLGNVESVNRAMMMLGVPFWRRQRTQLLIFVPFINLYVVFRLLRDVSRALEASKPRSHSHNDRTRIP